MKAVLALCVLAIAVVWSHPVIPVLCGTSEIVKIESIEASPWPVVRGKNESVTFHLVIQKPITGGSWEYSLKYAGRDVDSRGGYLRDVVDLPIQPGPWSHTFYGAVPKELPPGTASFHVNIKDDADKPIICFDVNFNITTAFATEPFLTLTWEDASGETVNVPIPYKNCGKPTDKLQITKADASVWPPKVGQPITVNFNATLTQDVLGGHYEARVKVLGLQILDEKGKIEDLAKKFNITLPIKAGPYGLSKTTTIPAWVPKGDIDVFVQSFNQKGDEIECIEVTAKLS
jgi:hypothetical protein